MPILLVSWAGPAARKGARSVHPGVAGAALLLVASCSGASSRLDSVTQQQDAGTPDGKATGREDSGSRDAAGDGARAPVADAGHASSEGGHGDGGEPEATTGNSPDATVDDGGADGAVDPADAAALVPIDRAQWMASASLSSAGNGASKAIDGNLSTRWTPERPQTIGQWFQVDMNAPQTFSQVTIDSAYAPGDFGHQYDVLVSNDGVTWGEPVASGTASASPVVAAFPSQTARFVRVVLTASDSSWWSIAEFNVWY